MLGKLSDAYIKAHSELLKAPIDNAFFQVSLATGHYDMAQKSREGLLYQNENAASKKKSTLSSPWQDKIQILRAEYTSLKNAMDRNDRTFIEEYVHANEKQALESYIRNFYGKRAFDSYQKSGKLPFAITE